MIQVSMVGYISSGAFLGLAYFDFTYHLVIIAVVVYQLAQSAEMDKVPGSVQGASSSPVASLALRRQ